jgi:hypothetical protein
MFFRNLEANIGHTGKYGGFISYLAFLKIGEVCYKPDYVSQENSLNYAAQ